MSKISGTNGYDTLIGPTESGQWMSIASVQLSGIRIIA